jgi:hypothetical protein
MYIQENSLVGDDDYMLIMNTAIAVCYEAEYNGNVAYSLGGYAFSDVAEEYCVEIEGEKRIVPHMATYTHFDEEKYLTVYGLLFEEKEDEANAYVEENGYWMGDLDSYVAYVNFESLSIIEGGYLVGGAGLECGSNKNYDLDFYEFQLKLFEKPYAYGFATEMGTDSQTGEPVEQFVWPLEMGNFVEKTYTYGERKSDPEEVQARILKQQRVKNNKFGAVPFEAFKKQMAVNSLLYKSLTYNKSDLRIRK